MAANGDPGSGGGSCRLADYFAIVDLDLQHLRYEESIGTVRQRFPPEDWPDLPFSHSLTILCQPQGWNLSTEPTPSTFFVNTLTDEVGSRQYAFCLQRQEECEAGGFSDDDGIIPNRVLFKPKVYVLVSRHAFFNFFQTCLTRISEAHLSGAGPVVESMIASLLQEVRLRAGEKLAFNLSGERLCLNAPSYPGMVLSNGSVALLARRLGTLHNLLYTMRAVLSEQKVILISSSFRLVSQAVHAIRSLLYPFDYCFCYVPALPDMLIDMAGTPTPLLAGLLRPSVSTLLSSDVAANELIIIDLDFGHIRTPEGIVVPEIPEPFNSRLSTSLQMVLYPEFNFLDNAEPPPHKPLPTSEVLDSQIRACFVKFYAEVLEGYRSALELVRLFPTPLIVFHRAAFIGLRGLEPGDATLVHQMLANPMFQVFVGSRGIPYRTCDVFDILVACSEHELQEDTDVSRVENIKELAQILYANEHQETFFPTTATFRRTQSENMTKSARPLDEDLISQKIAENARLSSYSPDDAIAPRIVPPCEIIPKADDLMERRLAVLNECVKAIFENHISEARKKMAAAGFTMRMRSARVRLCALLVDGMQPVSRATLQPQQFELLVRLINSALEEVSIEDEHGIAYACLYFSYVYCRPLSQGVNQYAYTCIQDHPVWENERFWESAFFHDVHRLMRQQYMERPGDSLHRQWSHSSSLFTIHGTVDTWNLFEKPTAMELAASWLQHRNEMDVDLLQRLSSEEEEIVFGQAKHYVNLMVYLRVPLDSSRLRKIEHDAENRARGGDESMTDSDNESGFIDNAAEAEVIGGAVIKWITRVVDRITTAAGLSNRHVDHLRGLIPSFVSLHIENLEQVYHESRQIPPLVKIAISSPVLTRGERIEYGGLRSLLLPEQQPFSSDSQLLPAEGALFFTNYRVIYKGHPINPLLADEVVIRAIPIMSLVKVKAIDIEVNSPQLDSISAKVIAGLHDCLQLRAAFHLMTVIFDEEVPAARVEEVSKFLLSKRWPVALPHELFCYAAYSQTLKATLNPSSRSKYDTFRQLSRLMPKKGSLMRKQLSPAVRTLPPGMTRITESPNSSSHTEDYLDMTELVGPSRRASADVVRKEHLYDLQRLRLDTSEGLCRISHANARYELCKTYPSVLAVPSSASDDNLMKVAKGFKGGRFPVIVWTSPRGALLVRAAAFASQTVVGKMKKIGSSGNYLSPERGRLGSRVSLATIESSTGNQQQTHTLTSSDVQEKYLRGLSSCSPATDESLLLDSSSMTSFADSSDVESADNSSVFQVPGDLAKRATTEFSRHASNLVRNSGRPGVRRRFSIQTALLLQLCAELLLVQAKSEGENGNALAALRTPSARSLSMNTQGEMERRFMLLHRRNLYIFGEQGQSKALKFDRTIDFIPVKYPTAHEMKSAFKKFQRLVCPNWTQLDVVAKYYRLLEESRWLHIVSQLLRLSACAAAIIHIHNSSVAFCLEDGSDATAQLSSLVQIISDPEYRTIKGFQALIGKEWLLFGHRFSHRANHTQSSQKSGHAPVFLIFLDALHQIMRQYPSAFEFNEFFLRFVAYHSQSAYFRNFLFDSEAERSHIDGLAPDNRNEHDIWTFVHTVSARRPLFNNPIYDRAGSASVLDIRWNVATLDIWEYFSEDYVAHGPPYDIESAEKELSAREDEYRRLNESKTTKQRTDEERPLDATRECASLHMRCDAFRDRVERLRDIAPLATGDTGKRGWKDAIAIFTGDQDEDDIDSMYGSNQDALSFNMRKLSLKFLMRGTNIMPSYPAPTASRLHQFDVSDMPVAPYQRCLHCRLQGTDKNWMRCRHCLACVHSKCTTKVTTKCDGQTPSIRTSYSRTLNGVAEEEAAEIPTPPPPQITLPHHPSESTLLPPSSSSPTQPPFNNRMTQSATLNSLPDTANSLVVTKPAKPAHSGVLFKKGATLKMWKPRFFLLDAQRHLLRYFESSTDSTCKGEIDLCDLENIVVNASPSHIPRKGTAIIELRTPRRLIQLLAQTRNEADAWKAAIEGVIRL